MSLNLVGEGVLEERHELLSYSPGLQDSGDLEPGTHSVTAASKQATPDYTANLTIAAPSARLTVKRLGLRLQVTIDSFGGAPQATQLSYSVEVNGVQRATGNWTATGAQYAVVDLLQGQFNLGTANEAKVYLWVDQGNAVVSLCQVWLAVGTTDTAAPHSCLALAHAGLFTALFEAMRQGTGSPTMRLLPEDATDIIAKVYATTTGHSSQGQVSAALAAGGVWVSGQGSVSTDLNYFRQVRFITRTLS